MPSYIEGDRNITTVIGDDTVTLKPILSILYDKVIKYDLNILYEDDTYKKVELVLNDKERPYKFIYKKDGKLLSATGIPSIFEISNISGFNDFTNQMIAANDLLFEVDCSSQYESIKVKFYLKDIRDIIDIAIEGDPDKPEEPTVDETYLIYLQNLNYRNLIEYIVDESLLLNLECYPTKSDNRLSSDEYSDFEILSVDYNNLTPDTTTLMTNIVDDNNFTINISEDLIDTEIKITLKYFVNEISRSVFDEFIIIPVKEKQEEPNIPVPLTTRNATTQDPQYLGDGLEPALGAGLTPGFKPYKYKSRKN